MIELVWLVPPDGMFEHDWIEYMFRDIPHTSYWNDQGETLYTCPVFIFNASVRYESYLNEFSEERIPFGVIHLSDETLGNTCKYLDSPMCSFAIRNYHHPVYSQHPKVITIGLGYKSGFVTLDAGASLNVRSQNPWFHWCFIGAVHHQERQDAIRAFLPWKPYLLKLSTSGFNSENLTIQEYKQTMILSKFALCPIGQGNIDTFRIYEAMEAGCIPVVISRTTEQPYQPSYWHALFMVPPSFEIPFIIGDTWDQCIESMEVLLQNPIKYYDLQQKMTQFWENSKTVWKNRIEQAVTGLKDACSP